MELAHTFSGDRPVSFAILNAIFNSKQYVSSMFMTAFILFNWQKGTFRVTVNYHDNDDV